MKPKQTFGNRVLIKLDAENKSIKFKDGSDFLIDTSYEPGRHVTITGTVFGVPKSLSYTGIPNIGMPWKTPMELKISDRVIVYYLAVLNAFRKETFNAVYEDGERYVFLDYRNIFVAIRNEQVIPLNGYCLIEPCQDPEVKAVEERAKQSGLYLPRGDGKSTKGVVYGIVAYTGTPNEAYVDHYSDAGVDIHPGDIVVMKKITDIPLEYELHARMDGGKKFWRQQRKNILAIYDEQSIPREGILSNAV